MQKKGAPKSVTAVASDKEVTDDDAEDDFERQVVSFLQVRPTQSSPVSNEISTSCRYIRDDHASCKTR